MKDVSTKNQEANVPKKKPPSKAIKSAQHELFSWFMGDESKLSNTVELWDSIPKYFFTPQQVKKLRTVDGLAHSYSYEYTVKDKHGEVIPCKVRVQPALIDQSDGTELAFFPTRTEEIIEEVLRKIFHDQQFGIHDSEKQESWVRFSYSMIRRELYRVKRRLRYDQIKHGIEVMSNCMIRVYQHDVEIYSGAILQDYCRVDRNKYIDDSEAFHVARLPIFLSHAVNKIEGRQYNYERGLKCKEHLAAYLHKRLVNRFTYANFGNDHHFRYSDVKRDSALLQQARESDNRKKVVRALEELKEKMVLQDYSLKNKKEGATVTDVVYTVTATHEFISEQKAANKINSERIYKAHKIGAISVDK